MSADRTDLGSPPRGLAVERPATLIQVFLVDDHPVVRRSVRDLLEIAGDFEVIGEAGSAVTAPAEILRAAPGVALVDLHLGDGSGVEVCRAVRDQNPAVATLVLTAEDDDRARLAAVLAGAAGYVLKLVRGAHLLETVGAAAAGDLLDEHHRAEAMRYIEARHPAELDRMTEAETAVLALLVGGRTDGEIAADLGLDRTRVRGLVGTVLDRLGLPTGVPDVATHTGYADR